MPNKERLETLKYMLENHDKIFPKIKFDMGTWNHSRGTCGTAACALGSAANYPPFIEQGLHLAQDNNWSDTELLVPSFKTGDGILQQEYEAGQHFFELTEDQAQELFNPDTYYYEGDDDEEDLCDDELAEAITTRQVIERIEGIIENG